MNTIPVTVSVFLLGGALLTGCDGSIDAQKPGLVAAAAAETEMTEVIELDWEDLIPADWRFSKLLEDMEKAGIADLSDDDPRAIEFMKELTAEWEQAPVVHDLSGKMVKLPGFVVPLEIGTEAIPEFLLVPYYGACIHVPPPPVNQTVYVTTAGSRAYKGKLFDTVWVTGRLKVERLSSDLGNAGYHIEDAKVDPFE